MSTARKMPQPAAITEVNQASPEEVLELALSNNVHHVCHSNRFDFKSEMEASRLFLSHPDLFFKFPISFVLAPNEAGAQKESELRMFQIDFTSSVEKTEILKSVEASLRGENCRQSLADDIIQVTDEVFTNAIYNAPAASLDGQLDPGVSRFGNNVEMTQRKFGRISLGLTADRILVSCTDQYGSLHIRKFLNKIKNTLQHGPGATMKFGSGGAGIGSYMIFSSAMSLYLGVLNSKQTTVACVFPRKMSHKQSADLGKNIHWIQISTGGSNGTDN